MISWRQRRACTGVGLNRKFTVRKFSAGKEWVPTAPCKYAHTNLKSESTLVPCTYSKAGKKVAELCRKKTCCRENNRVFLSDRVGVHARRRCRPVCLSSPTNFCEAKIAPGRKKIAFGRKFNLFPQNGGHAPPFCTIENLR